MTPEAEQSLVGWFDFEAYVDGIMAETRVPAVSISVARDGEIVFSRGFGLRDREAGLPATAATVYGIGSVTKPFTAMAVLQLEEEGKLALDDPVTRWLPEFRAGRRDRGGATARAMTLFHFLTHTSGMPLIAQWIRVCARSLREDDTVWQDPSFAGSAAARVIRDEPPIDTYEQYLEFLAGADFEVLGPPGAYVSYSNDAYGLLGAVIERASGRSYEEFVAERILQPLGMSRTTFSTGVMSAYPDVATLYLSRRSGEDTKTGRPPGEETEAGRPPGEEIEAGRPPGEEIEAGRPPGEETEVIRSPVWWEAPATVAAGWLRSNTEDVIKFLDVFRRGGVADGHRLLSPAGLARMTAPFASWAPYHYRACGFGLHSNYHGVSLVEHTGGLKGVSAHAVWVPERGITAVALSNLAEAPSARLAMAAVRRLLGLPASARRFELPAYDCPAERLPRYAGRYGHPGEPEAVFVFDPDPTPRLVMTSGNARLAGEPVGVDTFVFRRGEEESPARFLTDTRGEIWAVSAMSRVLPRREDPDAVPGEAAPDHGGAPDRSAPDHPASDRAAPDYSTRDHAAPDHAARERSDQET